MSTPATTAPSRWPRNAAYASRCGTEPGGWPAVRCPAETLPSGRLAHTSLMPESDESRPARSRAVLRNVSSRTWEHPADRGALVALRKLKGFDTVVKLLSGLINERAVRLLYLGSAIRVDDRQFPALQRALNDA